MNTCGDIRRYEFAVSRTSALELTLVAGSQCPLQALGVLCCERTRFAIPEGDDLADPERVSWPTRDLDVGDYFGFGRRSATLSPTGSRRSLESSSSGRHRRCRKEGLDG